MQNLVIIYTMFVKHGEVDNNIKPDGDNIKGQVI